MSSKRFKSLVYPITGHIYFEIDNIHNFRGLSLSETVKLGKCEWCLEVKTERSERTDSKKCLGVYLRCCSVIGERKSIEVGFKFTLTNQLSPGKDKANEGNSVFTKEKNSKGFAKIVEWSELVSGGYVKDDKILIECLVSIDSEDGIKRGFIDFTKLRPDAQDKKMIFQKKVLKVQLVEEDIEVSKLSESYHSIEGPRMFGLKTKLIIRKTSDSWAGVYFQLESEIGSKWWVCDVSVGFWIVNYIDDDRSVCESFVDLYSGKSICWGFDKVIKWDEHVDPAKGFVKNGNLKLQVAFQLRNLYGFDEMTDQPIERPMKEMTDVVLVVDGKRLNVPKMVLATKSLHFCYLFSSNPGISEFIVENVELENFIRFSELVHNVETDICEDNATGVLEAIVRFKAPECFEMCDKILRALDLKDTMQVLEWVDKYPLPGLSRKFLLKLKDDTLLQSITHSSRYKSLSSDMKVAILEWKLIPDEENRMEELERDEYEFRTDFKVKTELTDVEIEVDGYSYHASKQILANASNYFLKKFYGPYSEDEQSINIFNVSPLQFEKLLTHIYHPTRPVTYANIDSLLQLAHQFSVPRLMDKCEEYLVLKESIKLIDKLEYAGKHELPYLLESCLKWTKNKEKMNEVKSHHKFRRLESRVLGELMRREPEEPISNSSFFSAWIRA